FDYPVNSGHNGELRDSAGSERQHTEEQYLRVKHLGGMVALGHGEAAPRFVSQFRKILTLMERKNVAIGTDVNGFYPLPRPNSEIKVVYDSVFTKCTTASRTWDINSDGVAH